MLERDVDALSSLHDEDVRTARVARVETGIVGRHDRSIVCRAASVREPTACQCARTTTDTE